MPRAQTGNRPLSFGVAITQLLSVLISGPACAIGSAIYLQAWLERLGVAHSTWVLLACGVVITLAVAVMCLREIKLSATVMLVLEFLTVGVIAVLLVIVLVKAGTVVDPSQFRLSATSPATILAAAAFSVYSMAGFENAATLGREARDPARAVPFAVLASIAGVGILYIVGSYVFMLGFQGVDVSSTSATLDTLADHWGVDWLSYLIDLGVAISFFGSVLGIMAATSRAVFTLARDGLLPQRLATVSERHRVPSAAVVALGVFYLVVVVCGCLLADAETSYGALGTAAGYFLVTAYGLCALGAAVYALRTRTAGPAVLVCAVIALLAMGLVFFYSFSPFPEGVYGVVAWVFLGVVALTAVALLGLLATRSPVLDKLGASERT